jgi:hypothetical protein
MDDPNLRITISLSLFILDSLCDGVVECGSGSQSFGSSEAVFHGPFILIDREDASQSGIA